MGNKTGAIQCGDIVRGLANAPYSITDEDMARGLVTEVDGDEICVKILGHKRGCTGTYKVMAQYFEVIDHVKLFDRDAVLHMISAGDICGIFEYDLTGADLTRADLTGADLTGADLTGANLADANLARADLTRADLTDANLSGTVGLIDASEYLRDHFEKTDKGYIVYKTFGGEFAPPSRWKIEPGSIIDEVANPNRTDEYGCGVNVAPLKWVKGRYSATIWKCLIEWEWLPGVVVPYNTDGKIRCSRVRLLEAVA